MVLIIYSFYFCLFIYLFIYVFIYFLFIYFFFFSARVCLKKNLGQETNTSGIL